jgi:MarR family transcriptional regulator, lower aerobic nicotinate degradation pathway regulator
MGAGRLVLIVFTSVQMASIDHTSSLNGRSRKTSIVRGRTGVGEPRMSNATQSQPAAKNELGSFVLEDQVGFLLRAVSQRNTVLFTESMVAGITRVQFATLAKLLELGSCSQNELGRLILLDRATIKGVVNRLRKRGFVQMRPDANDRRQHVLGLTQLGRRITLRAVAIAPRITEKMLEHLNAAERKQIVKLLRKIVR